MNLKNWLLNLKERIQKEEARKRINEAAFILGERPEFLEFFFKSKGINLEEMVIESMNKETGTSKKRKLVNDKSSKP